jgi:hypothetical protein
VVNDVLTAMEARGDFRFPLIQYERKMDMARHADVGVD